MDKKTLSKTMLVISLFTTPILAENDQDLSQTEPSNQDNSSSNDNSNERDSSERKDNDRREKLERATLMINLIDPSPSH